MCAIFGVLDYRGKLTPSQRLRMVRELGNAAEVRGTDATGIAFFQRDKLCIQKAPKPARRMKYRIPAEVRYIMGHTRMTTQGDAHRNQNNHPFPGRAGGQSFALAHNGVLHNDFILQRRYSLPPSSIETDSYVAVQLIERQKEVSPNSLRKMAEEVEGSFAFTVLDGENNLWFVKGDNPLTIYHYPKLGVYLYASTEGILFDALRSMGMEQAKYETIRPSPGDILRIDRWGNREQFHFEIEEPMPSFFRHSIFDPAPWHSPRSHITQEEYIQAMKTVAVFHGFEAGYIDSLLADGYTTDDLEDLIYCGRS